MTHTDLKEAAMKATPGPWDGSANNGYVSSPSGGIADMLDGKPDRSPGFDFAQARANAAFIAIANPARILSLLEENQRLREALNDAIDCVEAWGGYASDYFKDKHDFQGDLDRLRAALKEKPHD